MEPQRTIPPQLPNDMGLTTSRMHGSTFARAAVETSLTTLIHASSWASTASGALFADADVCAQQETADAMISFAKSAQFHTAELIEIAVAYRRLARESVEIMGFYPSTPYCTLSPINLELLGVWNEQPEGITVAYYGGPNYPIVPFGDDASCPYGQTPDVTTCSCVSNFYGSFGTGETIASSPTNTTVATYAIPSDAPDASSVAVEPSSSALASDSVEPPVETGVTIDAASSTSAAPDAAATNPGGISGDINDPNGR
ncbi:hypothetical protein FB451DRAFT_74789 [Mycena latifolia]|nr:hypothetical protein FB451DRAFT_74789 [Mycena latifolia]